MQASADNSTIRTIMHRHSVRQFQDRPVDEDTLTTLLDCANRAPSAHNQQAWRFIIIRDEKKKELADLVHRKSQTFQKPVSTIMRMAARSIGSAPVVIAVMNTGQFIANAPRLFRVTAEQGMDFFRTMEIQSSSAAVENLLLAAAALGLGSVWLGILFVIKEDILTFLGEEQGEFMAVVAAGHPQKESRGPAKKPLDAVVRYL